MWFVIIQESYNPKFLVGTIIGFNFPNLKKAELFYNNFMKINNNPNVIVAFMEGTINAYRCKMDIGDKIVYYAGIIWAQHEENAIFISEKEVEYLRSQYSNIETF